MKLNLIIAAMCLSASTAAFADPFVSNSSAPSVIGPAPAGEQSLQTIADNLFGAGNINVVTGQNQGSMFSFSTPNAATSVPTLFAEFTANAATQTFGIWFGTDTTNVVGYDLLLGGATALSTATISIVGHTLSVYGAPGGCGSVATCNTFTNALINPTSFGFYFQASPSASRYYTLDQLNPGPRSDRVVSYQNGTSTNWLFAYEDGTDFDYNDMAVKVESITAAVPEPETYALMLGGLGALGFMARRRKKQA